MKKPVIFLLFTTFFISFFIITSVSLSDAQENLVLQYRVSADSMFPSSFIVEYPGGLSWKIKIVWEIPVEEKENLEGLLEILEKKEINGARFQCEGVWIKKGYKLKVSSINPLFEVEKIQ